MYTSIIFGSIERSLSPCPFRKVPSANNSRMFYDATDNIQIISGGRQYVVFKEIHVSR
jgi:hypothetical protein